MDSVQTLHSAMDEFLSSNIEIHQVDSVKTLDSAIDESLTSDIEIYQKPPK